MVYVLVEATHDGDNFLGVFETEEACRGAARKLFDVDVAYATEHEYDDPLDYARRANCREMIEIPFGVINDGTTPVKETWMEF